MNNMNSTYNDSEIEIDLKKIYYSLLKGFKWVVIIPSITVVVSIIYVFLIAKPAYTSETTLLLVNSSVNQSKLSSLGSLASQFGFSMPSLNDDINFLSSETLPEILFTRILAKSLLHTTFVSKEFDTPISLLNILVKHKRISNADSNKMLTEAIKHFQGILEIDQIKSTPMFILQVSSPEPQLSAEISLVVINELEKLQSDFIKIELLNKKEFISERLDDVQNELFQAETKLKNFREQNLQISRSPSNLLQQERLQREIEVHTQVYISLKQQFEQVKIEETENKSVLKIIDPPNIPITHSKPKKRLIVTLSGLIGLMIGGAIALVRYYW